MFEGTEVKEDEIKIERSKIVRMINRIYELERENTKTKKHSIKDIKAAIEHIIEEEAQKCY